MWTLDAIEWTFEDQWEIGTDDKRNSRETAHALMISWKLVVLQQRIRSTQRSDYSPCISCFFLWIWIASFDFIVPFLFEYNYLHFVLLIDFFYDCENDSVCPTHFLVSFSFYSLESLSKTFFFPVYIGFHILAETDFWYEKTYSPSQEVYQNWNSSVFWY